MQIPIQALCYMPTMSVFVIEISITIDTQNKNMYKFILCETENDISVKSYPLAVLSSASTEPTLL